MPLRFWVAALPEEVALGGEVSEPGAGGVLPTLVLTLPGTVGVPVVR